MIKQTGVLLALAVALAGCGGPQRPNIILVTIDTLRWDYLNTYGYPETGTTPAVSFLEENGIVFDNAITTIGTTVPAHASMLTGVYARQHGARSNFHGMYPGIPTVAGALNEAGYKTGAFVSNINMLYVGLLGRDFPINNWPLTAEDWEDMMHVGSKTVGQATAWMDTLDGDKPFFTWLHLWEPHGPYDINDWSRARLGPYGGMLKDGATIEHIRGNVREIIASPEHLEAMRTLYAGEVHMADRYLGDFLDYLRARELLDNTLIIFTADHGQSLGEGGRMGHGPNHRETVIRVPLIIADFRNGASGRVPTRISTIDIAPTIADAAGLEKRFDGAGRSLLDPAALKPDYPYFAEVAVRTETDRNWERVKASRTYDPNALAVYAGPFKMTFRHGRYQLYETAFDLRVARRLKRRDEKIIADYLQGLIESFQEVALDMSPGEASVETVEQLKSLGYTQ